MGQKNSKPSDIAGNWPFCLLSTKDPPPKKKKQNPQKEGLDDVRWPFGPPHLNLNLPKPKPNHPPPQKKNKKQKNNTPTPPKRKRKTSLLPKNAFFNLPENYSKTQKP